MIDSNFDQDIEGKEQPISQFYMSGNEVLPFDRSLATVSLRTNDNTPEGGYGVFLSASFGTQIIKLTAGETEFDILFEIYEAEVVLREHETELRHGTDYHHHTTVLTAPIESTVSKSVKNEAGISVSAAGPGFSAKHNSETNSSLSKIEISSEFDHAQIGLVKIGKRTATKPLTSGVIRDYEGWFALPNEISNISGVRAELNVTEHWVRFLNPSTESQTKLGKAWNFISDSNLKEHAKKKELFGDLLKRLSLASLQANRNDGRATLDIAAIICAPANTSLADQTFSNFNAGSLYVDETQLLRFLESPAGSEAEIIKSVTAQTKRKKRIRAFVPRSPVASALHAYLNIFAKLKSGKPLTLEEADKEFGANEVRDLLWLGLLSKNQQDLSAQNPYPNLELENAFIAVLEKQRTIQFVRNLLEDQPALKSEEIGKKVEVLIERNWKLATQHSSGHRLRSWTGFTYKEILGAEAGSRIFTYLNSAAVKKKKKGSPAIITGELKIKIGELKAKGANIPEISRKLGISSQVLHNYKSKHPDDWESLGR